MLERVIDKEKSTSTSDDEQPAAKVRRTTR